MAANPLQVVEALVTTVRNFTSDENYKAVAGVFEEIPLLKGQIKSKDTELLDLRKEIDSLKSTHEARRREELELYRTQHNRLDEEKIKLSRDISALTATIQERDDAIAELDRKQKSLQGQLDLAKKSCHDEMKKVTAANTEITKLQKSLKAKDSDIDKLKEDLGSEKTRVSDTAKQLQALRKEYTSRLSELEGFAKELHEEDEDIWMGRLDVVWESARQLVESHFKDDLPESGLEHLDSWKKFGESQVLDRLPLPRSNSPAAKQMRIAAMLAILARCIDQHIFQPTYILDEDDELRPLLGHLAVANSKKESFCRALLLSIDPEKQTKNASKRVVQAAREVAWYVEDVLSAVRYESFKSGLEQITQQALEAWLIAQSGKEKFEPYFVLDRDHYGDVKWRSLRFEEHSVGAGERNTANVLGGDEEQLVIFPRIYFVADGDPEPFTDGVVLMKSQSIAAAAEVDMERRKPSSPMAGKATARSRPNKPRKKSISMNGGSDFLS